MIIKNPNYFEHLKDLYSIIRFGFLLFIYINPKHYFTNFNNFFYYSKLVKVSFIDFQVYFREFPFHFIKLIFQEIQCFDFYTKIYWILLFVERIFTYFR